MGTLAAGIKDIFSTAKTTGTNVMLSDNDGTPDGHMTMANLASVLGVPTSLKNLKKMNGGDLNDIKDTGYYMFDGTVANRPTETSSWNAFFLAVIHENASNPNMCTQIYISSAIGSMFKRSFTFSQGAWQDWQEFAFNIPAFYKSYSDLSTLSSTLNTASHSLFFTITTSKNAGWKDLNVPTNQGSFLITISTYYESCIISVTRSGGTVDKIGGTTSSYHAVWKASESDSIAVGEVYCFTYTNNKWRIVLGISNSDMTYNIHVLY